MIMGKDILAKNQLFMIVNMSDKNSMDKWIKEKIISFVKNLMINLKIGKNDIF